MKRSKLGQFIKGLRYSPITEFQKGSHWRDEKPFWEKSWLEREYTKNNRTAKEIADQFGVTEAAVFFWMRKHKIPARQMKDIRAQKHWGMSGNKNGMYGATGDKNPNWQGGCTPERQSLYSSEEWARACSFVWKRDKAKCKRCDKKSSDTKLHVHHVVSFSVKELRASPDNLVLLCVDCHGFVHSKHNTKSEFIKKGA